MSMHQKAASNADFVEDDRTQTANMMFCNIAAYLLYFYVH